MADIKSAFGISTNSIAAIKNELLSLVSLIESTLLPKVKQLESSFTNMGKALLGPDGKPISTANQVSVRPPTPPAPPSSGGGGGGSGGSGNNNDVNGGGQEPPGSSSSSNNNNRIASIATSVGSNLATANLALNTIQSALPGVPQAVTLDQLLGRASFYGLGGSVGGLAGQRANVAALSSSLAHTGIATSAADSTQAISEAQAAGFGGYKNFNQILQGASTASILEPGLGLTGGVQAQASLNNPQTVNMLRTIGINMRSANGDFLGWDKVTDQIWAFLLKFNSKPTVQDIQVSMQPGGALYNMLSNLLNNDPLAMKVVGDGLIAKTRMNGAPLSTLTRTEAQKLGISSGTVNELASQTAAQTGLALTTAASQAGGFAGSAALAAGLNNFANAAGPLTKVLAGISSFAGGVKGIGGGALTTAVGTVGGNILTKLLPKILPFLGFLETGGPADAKKPYIVGEKGPELFVPQTDGMVIPNHMLTGLNRQTGVGKLKAGGEIASQADFAKALIKGLGGTPTDQSIADVTMWESKEGGNWNNTAKYNPLNTSYGLKGSVNFNSLLPKSSKDYQDPSTGGVQAYKSWQQGLEATIGTLTGADAKSRGYTDLVNALVGGGKSQKDFLKLMQSSSWDAGHYKGQTVGGGSSGTTHQPPQTSNAVKTIDVATMNAMAQDLRSWASGGAQPTTSTNHNYGGVSINISGTQMNSQQLVDAVQKALKAENIKAQIGVS